MTMMKAIRVHHPVDPAALRGTTPTLTLPRS